MTSRGPRPWSGRLAVALGAMAVLEVLAAVGFSVGMGWSWEAALGAFVVTNSVMGLAFSVCGTVIARHRPGNPIGLSGSSPLARSWRAAAPTRPVAVLDLQMPELGGFAATRELARAAPGVAVLVLTMFDDDDSVFAAMRAGARGYLVKGAEQEEIARAIHAVASGQAIFGPGVAQRVLGFFSAPPQTAQPFLELTPREREVLNLLAAGLSNAAIARRLGVAAKTVANTVSSVFTKLCVAGRPEAIVRARDAGLGSAAPSP